MVITSNKRRWFSSLRWKVFAIYVFISFIPLLFFSSISLQSIEQYFENNRKINLNNQANSISAQISKGNYLFDDSKKLLFDNYLLSKANDGEIRIIVLDDKGIVINDTHTTEIGKTYLVPEVMSALKNNDTAKLYPDRNAIYASASIVNSESKIVGAVLLVSSFMDVTELLAVIEQRLLLMTMMTGIAVTVFVYFLTQLMLDPLKKILRCVQKMSEGYFDEKVSVRGRNELSELGTAFNNMGEKLEQLESTRQEFVSNVSHELKTPLSAIKVLSDSILLMENVPPETYTEFLQDISTEIDRMTLIVNDLLSLVKLDQRETGLRLNETNINKMVEDLLKRLYPLAEQKDIEILYEDVRSVIINVDEMKLSLAISNLVENAIKYTYEGGVVKVIVDADHQYVSITVQDTGIGISEDEQSKIFTRFYRVDKTRDRETGGTGLGLAITHGTVLVHRGSIRLSSKENEGSTFVVRIPMNL